MYYTIYQITNKVTGKIYIGKHQTTNLNDNYMGSGKLLKRSQHKYGLENFKKEILYIFDTEEKMNLKEKELVTEDFCFRDDTYNICPGGKGGWGYINANNLVPIEARRKGGRVAGTKFSQIRNFKLTFDQQYRYEYSEKRKKGQQKYLISGGKPPFKGKSHTTTTKEKIGKANSEKQTGNKNSQFGTFWITNGSQSQKIKLVDIIPEGWHKGRVMK